MILLQQMAQIEYELEQLLCDLVMKEREGTLAMLLERGDQRAADILAAYICRDSKLRRPLDEVRQIRASGRRKSLLRAGLAAGDRR